MTKHLSGGTFLRRAWALPLTDSAGANNDMAFTEYLTDSGTLPMRVAFHGFLHPKAENTHGGPSRAIAILPVGQPAQRQAAGSP